MLFAGRQGMIMTILTDESAHRMAEEIQDIPVRSRPVRCV